MINAATSASVMPRQVLQWLDGLDLSYSVRNPKMDLANGFIIAEILTRKYPEEINIYTFYNAQNKQKKIDNWQQIQKCLTKKKFKLTKEEYQSIVNMGTQSALTFLFRIYEFLTGDTLNTDRRLTSTMPPVEEPLYKKPTASIIAKDRELHRVVDDLQKERRTLTMMGQQKNMIQTQKYNTGLIEWLIDKRKNQIQKQVEKQKNEIEKRTKSFVNSQSKVEVRQIELKCFNSSTSKKVKGQFGDLAENKGILDFLAESCSLLFKKESISNDLKKFGIEVKEKEVSGFNLINEVFSRCDEFDTKGSTKITPQTINKLLEMFKKTSEINLIVENINNNFIDFKKFFNLFFKPLFLYDKESESFKLIVSLITAVAKGLHKIDSENAEMMFEELVLGELLQIGENQLKRSTIINLCLDFYRQESEAYLSLVKKIKELLHGQIRTYISYLSCLIQRISRQCDQVQYNLWSQFFYYGFMGLSNPAPTVRVNGAKIISKLFTDVVVASNEIINQKLQVLKGIVDDPWWQVRAQALIIFKAILISRFKNQSASQDINQELNIKTILHCILQIFKEDVSHNILRIGLIELAELINYEENLCERYLEILLHVGPQIRADILNTHLIKYGPVVYGSNTFNYKLTGAPLVWNSLGIARVLSQYIKKNNIERLSLAQIEILNSTISKNGNFIENYKQWLKIYEEFKEKIFKTFLDEDLCSLGLNILKGFLEIKQIHDQVIKVSKTEFSRILSNIFMQTGNIQARENMLDLLKYLMSQQKQFTYKIIKQFAEREKSKYLNSNLVNFMNELSRSRRREVFQE